MGRTQIQKIGIGLSILTGVLLSGMPLAFGTVPECEDRTVCNGDFEQDLSYWESTDNVTPVSGRSGQGVAVAFDGANNDLFQLLPGVFAGGKTYRVTAWCLAEVGEQCGLFLGDANDTYGPPYEHAVWQWGDGTGDWRPIEAELTLSHDERLHVYVYSNIAGSVVIYDNVEVVDVTAGACVDRTVCNGDFEQGFHAWEGTENAALTSGRSGQGVRITHDEDNSDILQLLPGVFEAGGTYRVTAWCLAAPGELCKLFFGDANPEHGPDFEHAIWQWTEGTDDWQRLSHILTLSHEERLNVSLAAPQTSAMFDDVQVEELSDTSCDARTVCNGEFELETTSWSSFANATIVPGRSGQGVQVAFDGANNDLFQLLPGVFAGGKSYRATAWCLAEEGEQCGLFLGDANEEYGPPNEHTIWQWIEGNGDWQQISAVLTLSHEERLNVYLYSNISDSAVIYDDVQVEAVETYQLTVTKQGTGDGTVVGDGIDCGGDCTETYPDGTILDLQAIPYAGSEFVGWLVDDESPLQGGEIVINGDITLTAIFDQKQSGVALEFCGQSPNPERTLVEQAYAEEKDILRAPDGQIVGFEYWEDEKRMITLMSDNTFEVHRYFRTLVSNDAQTIVQVGIVQAGGEECWDPICPYTDLFFYNESGSLQKEIVGVHKFSSVVISEDGYVVVGGGLRDPAVANEGFVTLYDPLGNNIWSKSLGKGNWATELNISPSAETIAIAYVHQEGIERTDGTNHLLLFDKDGTEVFRYENLKYVNRILFYEQGQYMVVEASGTFSLRNLSSGEPSWIISRDYTLAGPHTIQIFEERNIAVLVALDFSDPVSSRQFLYRWHVHLLDLTTGEELFVVDLPDLHSGYDGRVVVPEDEHLFSIATTNELFCFRFKTEE